MSDVENLAALKAERARLDREIVSAEQKAMTDHNEAMSQVQTDLEAFADFHGIDTSSSRRKNVVNLEFGSLRVGLTLRVSLYYDEEEYQVGSTAVSVTDMRTDVTASFDAVPPIDALTGLLAGWLGIDRAEEK